MDAPNSCGSKLKGSFDAPREKSPAKKPRHRVEIAFSEGALELIDSAGMQQIEARLNDFHMVTAQSPRFDLDNVIGWRTYFDGDSNALRWHNSRCRDDVLFTLNLKMFVEDIHDFETSRTVDKGRLCSQLTHLRSMLLPNNKISVVVVGTESYFRHLKSVANNNYRSHIEKVALAFGSTKSTSALPTMPRPPKHLKDIRCVISRELLDQYVVAVEQAYVVNFHFVEAGDQFARLVLCFVKSVAEAPSMRLKKEPLTVTDGSAAGVVFSQRSKTKSTKATGTLWRNVLEQVPSVSGGAALTIASHFNSASKLIAAFDATSATGLQDLTKQRGNALVSAKRRLGPELSKRVFQAVCCRDGKRFCK